MGHRQELLGSIPYHASTTCNPEFQEYHPKAVSPVTSEVCSTSCGSVRATAGLTSVTVDNGCPCFFEPERTKLYVSCYYCSKFADKLLCTPRTMAVVCIVVMVSRRGRCASLCLRIKQWPHDPNVFKPPLPCTNNGPFQGNFITEQV